MFALTGEWTKKGRNADTLMNRWWKPLVLRNISYHSFGGDNESLQGQTDEILHPVADERHEVAVNFCMNWLVGLVRRLSPESLRQSSQFQAGSATRYYYYVPPRAEDAVNFCMNWLVGGFPEQHLVHRINVQKFFTIWSLL